MSECHIYSLPDIATFSQGKQIAVKDQYHIKSDDLERFIRIVDFTSDWTQEPRYVLKDAKYRVSDSDIVMLRYGTPGKVFRGHTGVIANNMFKITPNENILNKDYLYWYLMQDSVFRLLMANQSSSTMPAISFKMLNCISVNVPDKKIQKKICDILNDLDKKIAVNRCICENLEEQAQALFKHWFIDFAPFKDGKFVESELGMIPEGWRVGKLGEIAEVSSGKRPLERFDTETEEHNVPLIGASCVMGYTNEAFMSTKILLTGRVGTLGVIQRFNNACWPSDNTLVLTTQFYEFVYQILKTLNYLGMNRGTSQPLITQGDVKTTSIIIPPAEIINEFEDTSSKLMSILEQKDKESKIISTLRDTLLPKLMSGEIKV